MTQHDSPLVSICIANYNGMEIIDACVSSVIEQKFAFPVEIIVHDDASTDGSASYIREKYSNVTLIASTENVGFCVANNRMASAANGKYLLLLNNDAELLPDALDTLHEAAVAMGRPAILGLPQYDADSGKLIDIGSVFDAFLNPVPNLDKDRADVGMIIGACLWIPRSMWNDIGGFPEWFHTLAEDMYLCCVARLWGYPVAALPHSGFRHRVGHSLGGGKIKAEGKLSTSRRRRILSERNKTFVMMLTYPTLILFPVLPLHLATLIIEGAVVSAVRRDPRLWNDIYFSCLKSLAREFRRLLANREKIQARRASTARDFMSVFSWFPHKLRMLWRHGVPEVR